MNYQNKMKKFLIMSGIVVIILIGLGTYFLISKMDKEISVIICKGIDSKNEVITPLKFPIDVIENKTVYFVTDIQKKKSFYVSQIITTDGTAAYTKKIQPNGKRLIDAVKVEYLPNTSFYYIITDADNKEVARKKFSIANSNVTLDDFQTTIDLLQENKCVDLYSSEDSVQEERVEENTYYVNKKAKTIYIHAKLKNVEKGDKFIMKVANDGFEVASNTWEADEDADVKWLTLEMPNELSVGIYDAMMKYKDHVIFVHSFEVVN